MNGRTGIVFAHNALAEEGVALDGLMPWLEIHDCTQYCCVKNATAVGSAVKAGFSRFELIRLYIPSMDFLPGNRALRGSVQLGVHAVCEIDAMLKAGTFDKQAEAYAQGRYDQLSTYGRIVLMQQGLLGLDTDIQLSPQSMLPCIQDGQALHTLLKAAPVFAEQSLQLYLPMIGNLRWLEGFPLPEEKRRYYPWLGHSDIPDPAITQHIEIATPPSGSTAYHQQVAKAREESRLQNQLMALLGGGRVEVVEHPSPDIQFCSLPLGAPPVNGPLQQNAWAFSQVFMVDQAAFRMKDDRLAEIQHGVLRSVFMLSALRSFAWSLASYAQHTGQPFADIDLPATLAICVFVKSRELLNYDATRYFPVLCGTPEGDTAYVDGDLKAAARQALMDRTGCAHVLPLEALRLELDSLTHAMSLLHGHLLSTRTGHARPPKGIAADILACWCTLALSAQSSFCFNDAAMRYHFSLLARLEDYTLPVMDGMAEG